MPCERWILFALYYKLLETFSPHLQNLFPLRHLATSQYTCVWLIYYILLLGSVHLILPSTTAAISAKPTALNKHILYSLASTRSQASTSSSSILWFTALAWVPTNPVADRDKGAGALNYNHPLSCKAIIIIIIIISIISISIIITRGFSNSSL